MRFKNPVRFQRFLVFGIVLLAAALASSPIALALDDDILPVTAVPTLDFDGRADDDTLLPHPPPPKKLRELG